MKTLLKILTTLLLTSGLFLPVQADAGPKPQLIITVHNAPSEAFYLDLLVHPDLEAQHRLDVGNYDPKMIDLLKSDADSGWVPAHVYGTRIPMYGDIVQPVQNGEAVFTFTQGLPDVYKIILVTKSGSIRISPELTIESFITRIDFDASSGAVKTSNPWLMTLLQFSSTFIPTLLVEGLILWLFRMWSRKNLKAFLWVNLGTQIFLTLTLSGALIYGGILGALFVLILDEWIILITEALLYWRLLESKKRWTRVVYALVANLASFMASLLFAMEFFRLF